MNWRQNRDYKCPKDLWPEKYTKNEERGYKMDKTEATDRVKDDQNIGGKCPKS